MPIIHKHQRATYTIIDNQALRDPELSWRATGMLVYLLSLPDNWNVNIEDLTRRKTDGRTAARSTLQELKDAGYVILEENRDGKGQFHRILHVHETCQQIINQNSPDSSLFTDDGLSDFGQTDFGEADTKNKPEGNTEKESPTELQIASKPRDELWDTLTELVGEPGDALRSVQGRFLKRLRAEQATPDEIRLRAERLVLMWGPEKLTLTSLEKHWGRMGTSIAQVSKADVDRAARRAEMARAMESLR